MTIKTADRPLETLREEVVDTLIYNYSHGNITEEAFERRLDVAMDSTDPEKIVAQSADLEMPQGETVRDYETPHIGVQYSPDREVEAENIISIFGGSDRIGPWLVPETINSVFIFGGANIDFSQATFTSKQVTLKVFCLFGGGEINVPEGLQVSSSTVCIFGGVSNKLKTKPDYNGPILRIEGFVMFGGLDIKIKQTVKEKFVAFANQMKTLFDSKARY